MKDLLFLLIMALTLWSTQVVFAQSSGAMNFSDLAGTGQLKQEGLSQGRYEIRKSAPSDKNKTSAINNRNKPSRQPASPLDRPIQLDQSAEEILIEPKPLESSENKSSAAESPNSMNIQEHKKEGVVQTNNGSANDPFQNPLPKRNRLEILLSPTWIYNDSVSNYSYRTYATSFSAVNLGTRIWLSNSIGASGSIYFSNAASLPGNAATNSRVTARYELVDVGFLYRQIDQEKNDQVDSIAQIESLQLGLLYTSWILSVPGDNSSRLQLGSAGLGVSVTKFFLGSRGTIHGLTGSYFPRLNVSETKTNLDASSGSSGEHSRIGMRWETQYFLESGNAMVLGLQGVIEKNQFEGSATKIDIEKGSTPSNVSIQNNFLFLSFGFLWGR